jgi:hypothetical protein
MRTTLLAVAAGGFAFLGMSTGAVSSVELEPLFVLDENFNSWGGGMRMGSRQWGRPDRHRLAVQTKSRGLETWNVNFSRARERFSLLSSYRQGRMPG